MTPNQITYFLLLASFAALPFGSIAAKNNFEPPAIPTQTVSTQVTVPVSAPHTNAGIPGLKPASRHMQLQKIEELGKIHRFHRERISKAKKHETTFWFTLKLLLICCHVALLIHAFMHLTH